MNYEFKGTPGPWPYKKPTERFDACTVSESGKMIGYCVKSSKEDCCSELLRSKAPEMFEFIKRHYRYLNLDDQKKAEQLLKGAIEL